MLPQHAAGREKVGKKITLIHARREEDPPA
jgi:hypothetical protein